MVVTTLEDKKGEDILLLDIHEISDLTDYFVICSGSSDRMLQALADAVKDSIHQAFDLKGRIEGEALDGWILVDFGGVIVHLFSQERRDYYRLEELWHKGKVILRLQ
jgi:ribosome-associated protein